MTGRSNDIQVDSSLIRSVTYGTDATLIVRFHEGTVYRYFTVPRTVLDQFLTATSKGAYFNRNWHVNTRHILLAKAHAALRPGGRVLVYERLIDDDRRRNATALLSSLNMLVVTPDGSEFTGTECAEWMRAAGFRDVYVEPLVAAHGMVVGIA